MDQATLRTKYAALSAVWTERSRRLWPATEAQAIGYGGIAGSRRWCGPLALPRRRFSGTAGFVVGRGGGRDADAQSLRRSEARHGRRRDWLRDVDALVEPAAPGDPDSPLRWTCLSARTLAVAPDGLGHDVSHTAVAELLHGLRYTLQCNVKTREGCQHVDRDAQFRYIARRVRAAQRTQQPTVSVDEEERTRRGLQERRPHVAPGGGAATGTGPSDGGGSAWAVRCIAGARALLINGGCGWAQRCAPPPLEVGIAAARESDGLAYHRPSLPRHE